MSAKFATLRKIDSLEKRGSRLIMELDYEEVNAVTRVLSDKVSSIANEVSRARDIRNMEYIKCPTSYISTLMIELREYERILTKFKG